MNYIINKTVDIIRRSAPSPDDETMIRIDGFEDVRFYERLAHRIRAMFSNSELSVDIKLAKNKWEYFKRNTEESSYIQSLQQNDWVAEHESITRYRNMHTSNLLILMGTESEEDKGGLLNCFCITPDTILTGLDGAFSEVFSYLDSFSDEEKKIIDRLYKDLFTYVPADIYKLSGIADEWENQISNINDFVELFFSTLNVWGLPLRKQNLPTLQQLKTSNNVLKLEQDFISRALFRKMTITRYKEYAKKLIKYKDEGGEYGPDWEGWKDQAINGYNQFSDIVMQYTRGENVEVNRTLLENTEFDVIESVLGIKLEKEKKARDTITKLKGNPLSVFTKALLYTLNECKGEGIEEIVFEVREADVVTMYSDSEGVEETDTLVETWKTICRHTNGIIPILNRNSWKIDDTDVEICVQPEDVFSPSSAVVNVNSGIVKAAGASKNISKIDFVVKCRTEDSDKPTLCLKFLWEFPDTSAWKHDFSDICTRNESVDKNTSFIPFAEVHNMYSLIFAKSEEEFFDLYDEGAPSFDFDFIEYVKNKVGNHHDGQNYVAEFIKLGYAFSAFLDTVRKEGFYASISKETESEAVNLFHTYTNFGKMLTKTILPENLKWLIDAFIHAFNIEENTNVLTHEEDARCCIVPPWHPATIEKMVDQTNFFLNGCYEWWNREGMRGTSKAKVDYIVNHLEHMSMIQSALDLFPSGAQYFSFTTSFGGFSIYARNDIENNSRLKDIIHKDAVFDDDFNTKEFAQMNDNAKMIYGVIYDYVKSFRSDNNISLVFVNPIELQPIVAAVYKYVEYIRKTRTEGKINVSLKILVKPENKGGRNYLSYWMDEFFSQDADVNIRTYLNEWSSAHELDKFLDGNNDIVFMMDLLTVNNLDFVKDPGFEGLAISQCKFPIVYRPTPISGTTVKRKIELSQPQFGAAYAHTQLVRFRNRMDTVPDSNFIAVREVCINNDVQKMVFTLHSKAYWVVCIDSGMDGALLRNDEKHKDDYSIIGFSTGKGAYGQYNLTITARRSILESIKRRLNARLRQLFKWEQEKVSIATDMCIREAGKLDGISLFSAVNPKDHNVHEFMAYVLTSLREKQARTDSALKIMIHLDSYKHWFNSDIDKDEDDSNSRPDFLLLDAENTDGGGIHINATVIECKIAGMANVDEHKSKAVGQVDHGIRRLSSIFDPTSDSINRRYWFAQLYRALAFAQVTFSDHTDEFSIMASKLRAVLDGNFTITWTGKVLGYWLDMPGNTEREYASEFSNIAITDIPQIAIQRLLLGKEIDVDYILMPDELLSSDEEQAKRIEAREKELKTEIRSLQQAGNTRAIVESQPYRKTESEEFAKDSEIREVTQKVNSDESVLEADKQSKGANELRSKDETVNEEKTVWPIQAVQIGITGDERVLIGRDRLSNSVYWEFGNPQLSNRHMLITGTSGQGKTYSIQTMLYELSKSRVSAIVFDYTEGFRFDQLEKSFVDRMENRIKQHIIYYTGVPINPFKRQEIEVAGMNLPEKTADVAARIANIFKHVYGFGDQQFSAIFEAARKGLDKYGEQMNMIRFQEMLEEEKAYNKTAQSVISKMSPFFYSIEFNPDSSFDWGDILYTNEAELNIFQLTNIDREMQVIITELMLWDAWYYTKKVGKKNKPFVAVLDEAQNLSHKTNAPSAAILTEGRKFGWSAWFATQSLKVLSDDEVVRLMQAATKLYFKPTDDEILKCARQIDPSDGSTWVSPLKNLKKGQCIVVGDRIGTNGKFGIAKPTVTSITAFEERE